MDKEFAKKTLLITGATSGIGKAAALRFAEAGASIAAVGRDEAALSKLKQELDSSGVQCLAIRADLSLEEEAELAVFFSITRKLLIRSEGLARHGKLPN